MKMIIGRRGSGKTQAAIELAEEHGLYIVTGDKRRARAIFSQAQATGHSILFPVTPQDVSRMRGTPYVRSVGTVIVDDVDYLLATYIGMPVDTATLTMQQVDIVNRAQPFDGVKLRELMKNDDVASGKWWKPVEVDAHD